MRLSVLQSNLAKGLSIVGRAVESRPEGGRVGVSVVDEVLQLLIVHDFHREDRRRPTADRGKNYVSDVQAGPRRPTQHKSAKPPPVIYLSPPAAENHLSAVRGRPPMVV